MTAMTIDFNTAAQRHRRELHVHCYRMLGNFEEAEDALQEALLRGWRSRESVASDEGLRAWLYRIATNVCLDMLRAKKRRLPSLTSFGEVPWLHALPGPAARRGRAERGGAGRRRRRARDDRADLHRAHPAAAAAPARGAGPARHPRMVRGRDRGDARPQRRRRQQRAPARPRDAQGRAPRPSARARRADRRRAAPARGLHRHPRERRHRRRRRADARGHPGHDAAAPDVLRRRRCRSCPCSGRPRRWASGSSCRRA